MTALQGFLNKVVDFQEDENGNLLGVWLIPLVIGHKKYLPGVLPLKTDAAITLKLSGEILKTLNLSFSFSGGNFITSRKPPRTGWAYVAPELYSHQVLQTSDVSDAVNFPYKVRERIAGATTPIWLTKSTAVEPPGVSRYFLPIVVLHPNGNGCSIPEYNPYLGLGQVLARWVDRSVSPNEGDFIAAVGRLMPYSVALDLARDCQDEP